MQSTYLISTPEYTLTSKAITVGSGGQVLILANMNAYLTAQAYLGVRVKRDGVVIHETSQSVGSYADNAVVLNWVDKPTSGTHTYTLTIFWGAGSVYYYGYGLDLLEVH